LSLRWSGRDPTGLRSRVCIGSPEHCAELIARYAQAGCRGIFFCAVGDQRRQIEQIVGDVMPLVHD
jgi:alkanesulfonate monooxygenase SsuD/methylene tetrahydromethanopterin reductase-like flavin-dependent oxidoreductase (luciferase family)